MKVDATKWAPRLASVVSGLLLATFIQCDSVSSAARAQGKTNGWILSQSSFIVGEKTVYLSRNAVKVVGERNRVNIICKAPDYEVVSYSDQTRCLSREKLSSFQPGLHKMLAFAVGVGYSDIPLNLKAGQVGTTAGAASIAYPTTAAYETAHKNLKVHSREKTRTAKTARYAVADKISVEPQIALFLSRLYGVPNLKKVPLQFQFINMADKSMRVLNTYDVKQAQLSGKDFLAPSGYRKAARYADVLMNRNDQDGVDELFHGLSDAFHPKKKQK